MGVVVARDLATPVAGLLESATGRKPRKPPFFKVSRVFLVGHDDVQSARTKNSQLK
jgi:hypothetical protein